MGRKRKNILQFIIEAKSVHGDKYDYSKSIYIGANKGMIFICKKHGEYTQKPNLHLRGHGCTDCSNIINNKKKTSNVNNFILKSKNIHNNKYSYEKSKYLNRRSLITITCPIHGEFEQIARYHLDGNGCSSCKESRGEKKINNYLNKYNIHFEREKRFDNCRNILPLPFDFYLDDKKLLIEYDGEQHFKSVDGWGGEENLKKIKQNDQISTSMPECDNINTDGQDEE